LGEEARGVSRCGRGAEEELAVVDVGRGFARDLSGKLDRFGRTSEERSVIQPFAVVFVDVDLFRSPERGKGLTIEDKCRFDAN
jgi:hypothetical protein